MFLLVGQGKGQGTRDKGEGQRIDYDRTSDRIRVDGTPQCKLYVDALST